MHFAHLDRLWFRLDHQSISLVIGASFYVAIVYAFVLAFVINDGVMAVWDVWFPVIANFVTLLRGIWFLVTALDATTFLDLWLYERH